MPELLTEAEGTILEASANSAGSGRYRVLCISEGRGSSGVYPRETLIEAAKNKLIGRGTFAYLDHPSASEAHDRPERSVRDLAGVFTSDAVWSEEHKGLVAEMRVFAPYQQLIAEMKDVIGLSIRGDGEVEMREGQRTITSLAHIESVDWVTRAGRGGKVLELLEAARPTATHLAEARNVGQWVESAIHRDFTVMADNMAAEGRLTREERIQMSSAIGDALAAFVANLEANAPQLYQRDLWDEPTAPAVSESTTSPNPLNTTKEGLVPELTEAEVTALRDSAAQAVAARDTALAEAATARAERDQLRLHASARPLVAARLAGAEQPLPAAAQVRVVESVLAAGVPVVEGAINAEALNTAVDAAAVAEAAYLRSTGATPTAPTSLFGTFGSVTEAASGANTDISESDIDAGVGSAFGRTVKGN